MTVYGVIAEFSAASGLVHATKTLHRRGYRQMDTMTPYPIEGIHHLLCDRLSPLGWMALAGAIAGGIGSGCLHAYCIIFAYPVNISAKSWYSIEVWVPVTFNLMILLGALSVVVGFFVMAKLPMFYHPVFQYAHIKKASSHGFFLCINAGDTHFDVARVQHDLDEVGGYHLKVLEP